MRDYIYKCLQLIIGLCVIGISSPVGLGIIPITLMNRVAAM